MSTLYNNIVRLCEKKGVSPSGMCVELGVSKNIISRLKNREDAQLSYSSAKKFAEYFGVDVDEILRGNNENIPADFGVDDMELLDRIHARPELKILMHNGDKAPKELVDKINALFDELQKQ